MRERTGERREPVARESKRCDRVRPARVHAAFSCVAPPHCERHDKAGTKKREEKK